MKTNKASLSAKKKLKVFFKKYTFSMIFILFMANVGLLVAIRLFGKAQQCFTPEAISSDSRCLYIYNGKVFEKGTRDFPHNNHACGENVTSILPASHLAGIVEYLDPNYKGDMCVASSPTPTDVPSPTIEPTQPPVATGTPVPTSAPTITVPVSISPLQPSTIPQATSFISVTPISRITVQCLVPPPVLNLRIDCPLCGN